MNVNITPSKNILNPDNGRKLSSGAAKIPVKLKFEKTLDIEFEKKSLKSCLQEMPR